MIEHKARNKAGRAWIAAILDAVTRITRVDIDNITDKREERASFPVELLRRFIEVDGRDAVIFEISANEFAYLTGTAHRATKYVIRTYAFDVSDLPEKGGAA